MGEGMAKHDIGKSNEDVDENCNYCSAAKSTSNRFTWQCPFFDGIRKEHDPELASVPTKYLLACILCGIAPAMNMDGHKLDWGQTCDDSIDEAINSLRAKDETFHKGGRRAEQTRAIQETLQVSEGTKGCNARQLMLKQKYAHGSGCDLTFLDAKQIAQAMRGFDLDIKIPISRDGSHTTPTK